MASQPYFRFRFRLSPFFWLSCWLFCWLPEVSGGDLNDPSPDFKVWMVDNPLLSYLILWGIGLGLMGGLGTVFGIIIYACRSHYLKPSKIPEHILSLGVADIVFN